MSDEQLHCRFTKYFENQSSGTRSYRAYTRQREKLTVLRALCARYGMNKTNGTDTITCCSTENPNKKRKQHWKWSHWITISSRLWPEDMNVERYGMFWENGQSNLSNAFPLLWTGSFTCAIPTNRISASYFYHILRFTRFQQQQQHHQQPKTEKRTCIGVLVATNVQHSKRHWTINVQWLIITKYITESG